MKSTALFLILLPLFLTACGPKDEVTGVESFQFNFPTGGKIVDPRFGREVWFAYGPVAGRGGVPANGLAKTHIFERGESVHTLQVNIALPKEGAFYEGWLIDAQTDERISTGHLKSTSGDVRHHLNFETEKDLRAFTAVEITLEKDDGNPEPGAIVAKGVLKELKRDQANR